MSTQRPSGRPKSLAPAALSALLSDERTVEERLATTTDALEVPWLLLKGIDALGRGAVFRITEEAFEGLACTRALGDDILVQNTRILRKHLGVLTEAAQKGTFIGIIPDREADRDLLPLFDNSRRIAISAAYLEREPRFLLMCEVDHRKDAILGDLIRLARIGSEALSRLL
ncbi:MAG: hypothetical protein U0174_05490 [Polyangiaceae bacterium]